MRVQIAVMAACAVLCAGALTAPQSASAQGSAPAGSGKLDKELTAAIAAAPEAAKWPNSHYAGLLDLGEVTVGKDGASTGVFRESYKLFDRTARNMAEVSIPFNASYQSIKVLYARTIKGDGTVVNVRPEDIRQSDPYSEYLMYDDAKAVSFSMPAIEDGCVIDYAYRMVTRPLLMPGQFWAYWRFSGVEPVSLSRYVLHAPTALNIQFKTYNDPKLQAATSRSTDGSTTTYRFEEHNLDPIEIEPFMPPVDNCEVWMEASTIGDWQSVASWFEALQRPQATATPEIRATVASLTAHARTDDDKARAIYDWVANRTRYVGLEFGLSAYRPHAAADVYNKLYGDCKDKANLLITMLGIAGIKAHPVLLHAEVRRRVDQGLPTLTAFDHCIALADVGSREVWLDSTAETCAYGDIPDGDRGVTALVVRDGKAQFETIPTYSADQNGMSATTTVEVRPDGSAAITAEFQMTGAPAQSMRAVISELTPDKRKELMNRLVDSYYSVGATVQDYTLPDGLDKVGPYVMKVKALAPGFAHRINKLLLLPIRIKAGDSAGNPYSKDHRVWPIVQEEQSRITSTTTLRIPAGYAVDDLPGNMELISPLQSYVRTVSPLSADGTIRVTETTEDRAGTVPASDYQKMKSYYESVTKAADDEIVLKPRAQG